MVRSWSESMVRSIHRTDPPSPQRAVESPAGSSSSRASSSSAAARSTSVTSPRVGRALVSLARLSPLRGSPSQPRRARAPPVNPSDPVLRSSLGLIRDPPQPAARRAPRGRLRATPAPRDTGAVARALPSRPVPPRPAQPQACPRQGAPRPAQRPSLKPTRARRAPCAPRSPRAPLQPRPDRSPRSSLAQASPASAPGSVPPDHSPSPSSPVSRHPALPIPPPPPLPPPPHPTRSSVFP